MFRSLHCALGLPAYSKSHFFFFFFQTLFLVEETFGGLVIRLHEHKLHGKFFFFISKLPSGIHGKHQYCYFFFSQFYYGVSAMLRLFKLTAGHHIRSTFPGSFPPQSTPLTSKGWYKNNTVMHEIKVQL